MKSIVLSELSHKLGAQLIGDGNVRIYNISSPEEAKEGDITCALDNKKSINTIYKTKASAVILPYPLDGLQKPMLISSDVKLCFVKVLELFNDEEVGIKQGIDETVKYGHDFRIGDNVNIGSYVVIGDRVCIGSKSIIYPFVYIGDDVSIGEECIIYPMVVINKQVIIKDRVIIHSGTVIGSDGFGYINMDGKRHKILHRGNVVVEDDVEIGANVAIDRATTNTTLIKRGTKIDNLVHIAHNVKIGRDCVLVAQVGISGSVEVGDNVILAGQVGVTDHVTIGHNTTVAAKSGVTKNIEPNKLVSGFPAREHMNNLRLQALVNKLPWLVPKVKKLLENKIIEK